jgi:hypothetical protein
MAFSRECFVTGSEFSLPAGGNPLVEPSNRDLLRDVPVGDASAISGCELAGVWISKLSEKDLTPSMQRKTAHHPLPGHDFSYRVS